MRALKPAQFGDWYHAELPTRRLKAVAHRKQLLALTVLVAVWPKFAPQNCPRSWPETLDSTKPTPSRPATIDVEAFAYVECAGPIEFVTTVNGESQLPMPTSPHRPPSHSPLFRHAANVPFSVPPAGRMPPTRASSSAWKAMYRPLPRSSRPRTPMFDPDPCVRERKGSFTFSAFGFKT